MPESRIHGRGGEGGSPHLFGTRLFLERERNRPSPWLALKRHGDRLTRFPRFAHPPTLLKWAW